MEAIVAGILYGMASGWHCMGMCTPLYHVFIGKNKNDIGTIFIYFIGKLSGYLLIFSLFYVTLHFLKIYLPIKFLHILSLILGFALILITLFNSNFFVQFPFFFKNIQKNIKKHPICLNQKILGFSIQRAYSLSSLLFHIIFGGKCL